MSRPRTRKTPNQLAAIRDERGLKAGFVAEKLGVSTQTLNRWESVGESKPPRMATVLLSHFYGLPVAAIEEAIANARLQA